MNRIKLLTAAATAALLVAPAAFAQTPPPATPATPATPAATPATPATAAQTPASAANVIEALKARGQFTFLLQALDQAQLTETLATRPRITLFAPSDAVFAQVPEAERIRLLDPTNIQELRNLLLYHVLVADLTPEQILGARGPIATAGGVEIHIDGTGDTIAVAEGTVTEAAIDADNGGIYVIDKLLDPAAAAAQAAEAPPTPAETAPAEAATDDATDPATPST